MQDSGIQGFACISAHPYSWVAAIAAKLRAIRITRMLRLSGYCLRQDAPGTTGAVMVTLWVVLSLSARFLN
jgi:hypothetical protein